MKHMYVLYTEKPIFTEVEITSLSKLINEAYVSNKNRGTHIYWSQDYYVIQVNKQNIYK